MDHPSSNAVKALGPKPATLKALAREIVWARTKFPSSEGLFLALVEEVGEVAKAELEKEPIERRRMEALQVACVAIRIYEEMEGEASEPADFVDNDPDGDHATEEQRGRWAKKEEAVETC